MAGSQATKHLKWSENLGSQDCTWVFWVCLPLSSPLTIGDAMNAELGLWNLGHEARRGKKHQKGNWRKWHDRTGWKTDLIHLRQDCHLETIARTTTQNRAHLRKPWEMPLLNQLRRYVQNMRKDALSSVRLSRSNWALILWAADGSRCKCHASRSLKFQNPQNQSSIERPK